MPEKVIKVYPIFEIDLSNNTWRIVYTPENLNYNVVKDKNNHTWIAVPKK